MDGNTGPGKQPFPFRTRLMEEDQSRKGGGTMRIILLLAAFMLMLPGLTGCADNAPLTTAGPTETSAPAGTPASTPTTVPVNEPTSEPTSGATEQPVDRTKAASLEERAKETVLAWKNKDAGKLQLLIHPDKGVRFSPYANVNKDSDIVLTADQTTGMFDDNTTHTWGSFDGSGEPIEMTFADYYSRFVYDCDFEQAEQTAIDRLIGKGNTTNNQTEAYPDASFV